MNFDRIALLLHVVEGTRNQPKLKAIHDEALAELEGHASGKLQEPEAAETTTRPEPERRL